MELETCKAMCYSLAKAYTTGVRLYENNTCLYYYSPYDIEPDPLGPYLYKILASGHKVGIITTPLSQYYAFLTLESGIYMILGPTCALLRQERVVDKMLTALQIPENERDAYAKLLFSLPVINIERLAWLLVSLEIVLEGKDYPVENVWIESVPENVHQSVKVECTMSQMNNLEDLGIEKAIYQSLNLEDLILNYVEEGETGKLRELFKAPPKAYLGRYANTDIKQRKNRAIVMITNASRAAIRGGLDASQAFVAAEHYVQKLDFLQDIPAVEKFSQEMIIDYAEQTEQLKCPHGNEIPFCRKCFQYISRNINNAIRVDKMAEDFGISRQHLCSRFKKETGVSVSQYIQQEKIKEAERMLRFSERAVSEIASILGFSSQSHFQTVFKKVTGETPLHYRERMNSI
ncbi:MAG: helix-turn-helix domain-containing protein [Bariatricus sp.]